MEGQSGLSFRLLSAAAGLLAAEAVLFLVLSPGAYALVPLYSLFAAAGWAIALFPVISVFRAELLIRAPWLLIAVIGAALGPAALFLVVLALATMSGASYSGFRSTGSVFRMAAMVSMPAFLVYSALVRRHGKRFTPASSSG